MGDDDASHIGVMPPTPGRMVRVIGPGFDAPAVIVGGPHEATEFGPLVFDVVVFQAGYTRVGYLGDTSDLGAYNGVVPATVPHKTTRDAAAAAAKPLSIGPCYWIWPTETP
jgi:hypothetical protein